MPIGSNQTLSQTACVLRLNLINCGCACANNQPPNQAVPVSFSLPGASINPFGSVLISWLRARVAQLHYLICAPADMVVLADCCAGIIVVWHHQHCWRRARPVATRRRKPLGLAGRKSVCEGEQALGADQQRTISVRMHQMEK